MSAPMLNPAELGRVHGPRPIGQVLAGVLGVEGQSLSLPPGAPLAVPDWHPLASPAAAKRFEGLRTALAGHGFALVLVSDGHAPAYFLARRGAVVQHLATLADVLAFTLQLHGLHLTPGATQEGAKPSPYLVTLQPLRATP
jgi:hypothetical protein